MKIITTGGAFLLRAAAIIFFTSFFLLTAQAATFTVTKIADTNDGACNADCSLREAIAAANAAGTNDTIEFDAAVFQTAQTITLGSELVFFNSGSLTINGPGSNLLTVSGNNQRRVFFNEAAVLTISGLKITGGNGIGSNSGTGGAIFNGFGGTLNLNNSVVTGNTANRAGGIYNVDGATLILNNSTVSNNTAGFGGGGIYTTSPLTVNNSTISGNAGGDRGGGILNSGATVNITDSTISGNSVESSGGGIVNYGTINLAGSTVSGNTADFSGGGISSPNTGTTVNITNSTVSGNSTDGGGGGISIISGATVNLSYATVTNNKSDADSNNSGSGGGINNSAGGTVNAGNSIIAGNIDNTNAAPDFSGTLSSQGYNLIFSTSGLTINGTTTGNILGQPALLLPLANYGGAAQTHAVQPGSPAIDAANPANFPSVDQRGLTRPRDGDLNGSLLPDIGAFERQIVQFTVTKTADTNDGACDADCSLREAVAAANAAASPTVESVIIFYAGVFNTPQVITLTLGELQINNNGLFSIQGTGANLLTVSGGSSSRVFYLTGGVTATFSGIKITGGNAVGVNSDSGGAIYNSNSTLTLNGTTLTGNTASFGGGAIYNLNGTLNLTDSSITNNTAGNIGGGVWSNNAGSDVNVTNCIFSGNSGFNGGGIHNFAGTLSVNNSTFNNNTSGHGGGIHNFGDGTVSVSNSTFNSNTASSTGGGINNNSGELLVINSTISQNQATGSGSGGGIYSSENLIVMESIINNNSAGFAGGGIYALGNADISRSKISGNTSNNRGGGIAAAGNLTIRYSLINGNTAAQLGGGISNGSFMSVFNSTIAFNSANGSFGGGGIFHESSVISYFINATIAGNTAISEGGGVRNNTGTLVARNTIIGNNNAASGNAPDFSGTLTSQGHNLIENTTGTVITQTTTGNITGQDPRLGALSDNGGPTETFALLPGSPAIDAADTLQVELSDQRGFHRPRDGDGDGLVRADIGAFEFAAVFVNNTDDSGAGSLRQALVSALIPNDGIIFNQTVFNVPRVITLTSGELVVPAGANIKIYGSGADKLTISGNNQSRVFYIGPGAKLTLSGLTISGGNGTGAVNSGHGGAIYGFSATISVIDSIISDNSAAFSGGAMSVGDGTLWLTNSTIRNNTAVEGGGIDMNQQTLVIDNSTINNNSSQSRAGGILVLNTVATITNSTISGNTARTNAGGIYSNGTLTLTGSTIAFNIADADNNGSGTGGGIYSLMTLNARNTLFAKNKAAETPNAFGLLTSQGYNLIDTTNGMQWTGTTTGNIFNVDARLDPILRNNGGATQTHALRVGSPALDKGSAVTGITTDQRGLIRPFDFPSIPNASGGNGSDIGAFEQQANDIARNFVPFDFDGDGKTDISIFRPSNGEWWINRSSTSQTVAAQFGNSSDKPVPADFTGDGKTDIAFWRPSTGEWFLLRSEDGSFLSFPFGASGDVPLVGDFDADGKADPTVFRASTGEWFILKSTGGTMIATFGTNGDQPVPADFDGDGKTDIAIFRPADGSWWYVRSSDNQFRVFSFGLGTDKPVQGDYTGDGKADIAIYRPSTGEWFFQRSEDNSYYSLPFGTSGDIPTPGDYDGDGRFDTAVFRPSATNWYVQRSTAGLLIQQFGVATDRPVPSVFVP